MDSDGYTYYTVEKMQLFIISHPTFSVFWKRDFCMVFKVTLAENKTNILIFGIPFSLLII